MKNEIVNDIKSEKGQLQTFFRLLLILLTLIIIFSAIAFMRGQLLVVRTYSVPARTTGKVRIVALADLHGCMLGKDQERIVEKVRDAEPEIIVYLGDMIERVNAVDSVESLVVLTQRLSEIAPIYYVNGNHEDDLRNDEPEAYKKLNTALNDIGAVQLNNETVRIMIGDTTVNLCGIASHYYWDNGEDEVAAELRGRDGINVMLCHYPETVIWREAFEGGGLDLALCGHTHGGLVRVPFRGGLYAPEWGWWPMYDMGEYPIYSDTIWKNYGGAAGAEYWGTMIISGGLAGEHGVPRINNPMEISVVDIGH